MASPLIVKAMPLADGRCVPIALWLHRNYPANGSVGLSADDHRARGSHAPFDVLTASGDAALYAPLDTPSVRSAPAGQKLRRAFLDWLVSNKSARRIV